MKRRFLVVAVVLALSLVVPMSSGVAEAKPAPPQSKAYGKSLSEWMSLYFRWALGGNQADHVGNVKFLPLPQGTQVGGAGTDTDPGVYQGALNVTLQAGTAFVLPVVVWFGESYTPESGIPDDPELRASIFTGSNVLVTLDGKPLLDSSKQALSSYYVKPTYYNPPIVYKEPTNYGSISTIYIQGIGFVHHPLSVGTHTLKLHSELIIPEYGLGQIYNNTWTITVRPRGK